MRDLGGYPAANGAVTRWRTFIRSDVVRDLPGCDAEALRDIGLTTVIDLRSETEAGRAPSAFGRVDWIDCHQVSILPEPVIDRSMQDAPFKELYILFADRGRKKLGAVFSIMAKSRGMCLIHCFAGKDRTGIVAALLLLLAGVAEDDVIADYEVSATYYRRQAVLLKSGVNAASQSHILSDRETIVYFIRHIENRYGGAEKYLLGAGVGAGDIEALRGRFVAPAPVSAPVPAHAPVSAPAPAECL
ncbi:MAG: tyrosine-protein phosphatase [Oscillospiraceae bacterium]|nr:tyrosine-protein phosphatase [Oscillospiraceae bacterium]